MTVNNLTVCYTDEGPDDGPVVIFIHGFPLNKSMWDKQVEALRNKYRVIAYDIRGHGNSFSDDEEFSIDLFVNDLICFMDNLNIATAVLCGLSMGGYIAMNAVSNYPERFDALILSDTQCVADTPVVKAKRMLTIENIKAKGIGRFADESIKSLFALESFDTKKNEIADVREMIEHTSNKSLYNTLHALANRDDACNDLLDINVPVLIMVGRDDALTPPYAARKMHEYVKDSTLVIIEHAGHLSNMENPYKFNNQLKKFLASIYEPASLVKVINYIEV